MALLLSQHLDFIFASLTQRGEVNTWDHGGGLCSTAAALLKHRGESFGRFAAWVQAIPFLRHAFLSCLHPRVLILFDFSGRLAQSFSSTNFGLQHGHDPRWRGYLVPQSAHLNVKFLGFVISFSCLGLGLVAGGDNAWAPVPSLL